MVKMKNKLILLKEETFQIIGACMTVHTELGSGLLEAIYQAALEEEFKIQKLPHTREKELEVFYKNKLLNKKYQADFICHNEIIVELKATSTLEKSHEAQLINYLNITKSKVGLLINFGNKTLEYKRFITTK